MVLQPRRHRCHRHRRGALVPSCLPASPTPCDSCCHRWAWLTEIQLLGKFRAPSMLGVLKKKQNPQTSCQSPAQALSVPVPGGLSAVRGSPSPAHNFSCRKLGFSPLGAAVQGIEGGRDLAPSSSAKLWRSQAGERERLGAPSPPPPHYRLLVPGKPPEGGGKGRGSSHRTRNAPRASPSREPGAPARTHVCRQTGWRWYRGRCSGVPIIPS